LLHEAQISVIVGLLNELADFYLHHILKKDKEFFVPSMSYFSEQEQVDM
jgi:hypothetical protein